MKYNTNPLVFLTWYRNHCSNPLVCRSLAVLSSWVSSAAVVVSSTTAPTVTSVHQRPLPCRRHRFRFSDQTIDYIIGTYSLWSAFLWIFVFIGPSIRLHAPPVFTASLARAFTRRQDQPRAVTRRHAPACARDLLLTSALGDVIFHVIHHVICWRHPPRTCWHQRWPLTLTGRWLWPLTFCLSWLLQSRCSLPSFSRRFYFCRPFLHILLLNEE